MKEAEFVHIFADLEKAYGRSHTPGEIQSYWRELKDYWADDFRVAAQRLPANEPPTAYRPFPTATTIREYILDAQEARRLATARTAPTLDTLEQTYSSHIDRDPSEQAFGHLCLALIRHSLGSGADRRNRVALIDQFCQDHADWLDTHAADTKAWLAATRAECVPQESRA